MVTLGAYIKLYKFQGYALKQTVYYAVFISFGFILTFTIDMYLKSKNISVHYVVYFICILVPIAIISSKFEPKS